MLVLAYNHNVYGSNANEPIISTRPYASGPRIEKTLNRSAAEFGRLNLFSSNSAIHSFNLFTTNQQSLQIIHARTHS